jgi:hypothetical protein
MHEGPHFSARKEGERGARTARLAAALRENLRRRKEQQRARTRDLPGLDEPPADLSGDPPSGKSGRRGAGIDD